MGKQGVEMLFEEAHATVNEVQLGLSVLKRFIDVAEPGCPHLDMADMLAGTRVLIGALAEQLKRADETFDEVEVNAKILPRRERGVA